MPTSDKKLDLPVKLFKNSDALTKWLDANHAKSRGVWMRFAKKGSGMSSVTYPEAIEVALCYGWIDGQAKPFDDKSWLQRFTPRRPQSVWSQINTARATALIEKGRMRPAGLAAIKSAQADGRWESAYQPWSSTELPPDLRAALDANPKAKEFFATLKGANRYAVIFRVSTAKKPETRAARIAKFVAMLENGETLHGQPKTPATKSTAAKQATKKAAKKR